MNNRLTLYGTLGCHLCDEAKQEILKSMAKEVDIDYVDIANDTSLFELYGTKIPVLEMAGTQLYWPFTSKDVDAVVGVTLNKRRRYLR
ncbi:glutaredoxin family protein [Marinomonas sp. 15G1-11]|uniref:Glutaredoxin family protein n=1 Tax=Marinomonas phaeophyticola TaxID=3004091 RepID=A0ABT4JRT1_9GAMM|nr:glutaredoxin family protein [Marinomonas sp. 15G1-11]MCZ2720299.1 glutaredoxin family protein [Marinomonas sp. 15G1-11]